MATSVESMNWEDLELEGIAWADDGRALVIRMSEPNDNRRRVMTLRWPDGLQLKLGLKDSSNAPPLTWDGKVTALPDGRCSLHLDFASDGELYVRCNEIEIQIVDP